MKKLFPTSRKKMFMPGFGWIENVKSQVRILGRTFTLWNANHPFSVHSISEDDVYNAALTQLFFQKRLQS